MKSNYKKILDWFVNLYPVWIISSSFIGFFYRPAFKWFIGSYMTGALAVVMLGMGLTLRIEDFRDAFIKCSCHGRGSRASCRECGIGE